MKINEDLLIGDENISLKELAKRDMIMVKIKNYGGTAPKTLELIEDNKIGTSLSLSNNKILIGSDISKVKISFGIIYQSSTTSDTFGISTTLIKNTTDIVNVTAGGGKVTLYYGGVMVLSNYILKVNSGDTLSLRTSTGDNLLYRIVNDSVEHGYFTVEVIE